MTDSIKLTEGGIYTDARGTIGFVNDFDMKDVRRFYRITHPDTNVVRAWQGHKKETKYFTVLRGAFRVAAVKIDDFDNPSPDLKARVFTMEAGRPQVLQVAPGYANGIQAMEPDSQIMVFSDKTLEEAQGDQVRFDSSMWEVFNQNTDKK